MFTLALLSYGSERELKRALFCLYSFLAQAGPDLSDYRVCLYTDRPEWFTQRLTLAPGQLVFQELHPDKLASLRGPADFYLRPKICLMLELLQQFAEPTLFVDSDTFFVADPRPVFERISPTTSLLHEAEYPLSTLTTLDEKHQRLWKFFQGHDFELAGQKVAFDPAWTNWNSGTIGLHPDHIPLVENVLRLTDAIYPPSLHPTCEQYAFSIVLQNGSRLEPAGGVIYHYWYHVKKRILDEFIGKFLTAELMARPQSDRVAATGKAVSGLSHRIHNAPVLQIDRALRRLSENKFREGFWLALKVILTGQIRDLVYYQQLGREALRGLSGLLTGRLQASPRRGFVAD